MAPILIVENALRLHCSRGMTVHYTFEAVFHTLGRASEMLNHTQQSLQTQCFDVGGTADAWCPVLTLCNETQACAHGAAKLKHRHTVSFIQLFG